MGCCGGDAVKRAAHGAAGLVKATFGVDRPVEQVVRLRLGVCKKCPRMAAGLFCKECKCLLPAKARIVAEDCPLGKWPKLSPQHHPKTPPAELRGSNATFAVPRQTGPRMGQ